jgi:hypothetical protein
MFGGLTRIEASRLSDQHPEAVQRAELHVQRSSLEMAFERRPALADISDGLRLATAVRILTAFAISA